MTATPEQPNGQASSVPPKMDLRRMAGAKDAKEMETKAPLPKVAPADPTAEEHIIQPQAGPPRQAPSVSSTTPLSETLPMTPPSAAGAGLKVPPGPQPQTIHIKIPKAPTTQAERTQPIVPQPTAGKAVSPTAAGETAPGVPGVRKKETTKIPLTTGHGPGPTITAAPSIEAPKTIRIRPKSAVSTVPPSGAESGPRVLSAIPADAMPADKRKTSRISLEAALIAEGEQEKLLSARGPKTIRLHRPAATAATVKMPPAPSVQVPGAAASIAVPASASESEVPLAPTAVTFEDTARLESPPAPTVEPLPADTRRKTIKVKRPTQRPGVTALPTHTVGVTPSAHLPVPVVKADVVHAVFPVFAIAGLVVILSVAWMLCAQAFGRNACLTQYSYGNDPDLPWYGKLPAAPMR